MSRKDPAILKTELNKRELLFPQICHLKERTITRKNKRELEEADQK